MKTTAIILLVCCLHVSARSVSQTVTISGKDLSLSKVFTIIKKQTGYTVFGNASLLRQTSNVSISVSNMPLTQFLDSILRHEIITYRILDRTIILYKRPVVPSAGLTDGASADKEDPVQDAPWQIITGYVISEDGTIPEGVNVKVKGTNIVAAADSSGKFVINANQDQVLVFTHVNMMTREVRVKDFPANGRILLKAREARLNDVVVTGYGTIRKESFTGTYTQVTKADIQRVSSNNLIAALQVFDPSFRIVQNINMGSNPNVLPEFYIRGQSGFPSVLDLDKQTGSQVSQFSLRNNPNTPIFILDGFEVDVEKVYDMDINRINNVTILKDAAATAMYGSRASNGVVVIETIAPKAGEFRTTYSGNYSVTAPDLSSYHMMNARQKLDAEYASQVYLPLMPTTDPTYESTLIGNRYKMQMKENEILKGVNTYWLSQPLSTMLNHKHNIYIEGGSQAMRVGLELKYDNQNGVMKESFRQRLGAGLTLQYQTGKLQLRNQAYFDAVSADDSPFGRFSDYSRLEPYYPIRDENTGAYLKTFPLFDDRPAVPNPLYESTVGSYSKARYREWTDNFTTNYYLTKFLFIRGQFAVDYKQANTDSFTSPLSTTYGRVDPFMKGELLQSTTNSLDWNINLFGSYNQSIGVHNINISAGINAMSTGEDYSSSVYRGFPSPEYHSPAYAYQIITKPTFSDNKKRLFGSFATLNYSLKDIYLLDASYRVDGSSEFGTEKKWAPFWSLGTGVNLHNTSLFGKNPDINILRVTANIGQTGKSNFSPYMARDTYQMMLDDWYPTGIGSDLIYLGNNNLTWEKQLSWNIGANMALLKRFTVELDYYNKKTYDLITDVSLPSSSGFTVYRDNIGKVLNKGFEIKTSLNVVNTKNINITLIGNMAHNKNSIIEISQSLKSYNQRIDDYYNQYATSTSPQFALIFNDLNSKFSKPIMKYEEGSSLTTIYGMKSLGISPSNGKEVFLKRDGTVTYDWDPAEQQPIGNTEPWAQGSFGFNARYKQFTVYSSFLFQAGGDQYNQTMVDNVENVNLLYYNADTRVLTDRWQKPGDVAPLKAIQDRYFVTRPTSRFVQKDNTVAFNSLSLSYDFIPAQLRKTKLKSLRASFLMNDIAQFSSIKREMGLDYPYARTFTFTINTSF